MITALFTGFRLEFKIKYTEIVPHDRPQKWLQFISSRFNSNSVRLSASHSSKSSSILTFLQQKHDKGRHISHCGARRVSRYKATAWQLVHLKKNLLKAHKNSLVKSHFEPGGANIAIILGTAQKKKSLDWVLVFFPHNCVQSRRTTTQQFYVWRKSARGVIKQFQIFLSYF